MWLPLLFLSWRFKKVNRNSNFTSYDKYDEGVSNVFTPFLSLFTKNIQPIPCHDKIGLHFVLQSPSSVPNFTLTYFKNNLSI